mgnify:CR=1 FL=1|jgi:AGZA family xanthine/uracil permease-like MFS transporter
MLEKLFHLKERGTTAQTEVIAGFTTFMTMAYIIFVNPVILKDAGMPPEGVMTATALVAAIMTIAMGLFTNYPFALAAGMGINSFVAYTLVLDMGLSWQTAMGIIFWEGLIITILVLTRVREAVMNAIPLALKQAIGVGIGLFIAFIGLKQAGIMVPNDATIISLGNLTAPATIVSLIGLLITIIFVVKKVKGAILWGIISTAVIGLLVTIFSKVTVTPIPQQILTSKLDFSTIGKLDIGGAMQFGLLSTIFALMLSDFFDTMGTVISVGGKAHLVEGNSMPRLQNVLLIDSLAAMVGGIFGASSATTYVESTAGVAEGGRTGLTAVVTGILFLLSMFFVPLAGIIPSAATAPALIIVGFLMLGVVKEINFEKLDTAIPAFITLLTIPLTFSIANGIGLGFISYTLIKLFTGKYRDVHPLMYVVSILFFINFFFL